MSHRMLEYLIQHFGLSEFAQRTGGATVGKMNVLKTITRMICLIDLERPLKALHYAEEDRKEEYDYRDPESIPPFTIPAIMPPL